MFLYPLFHVLLGINWWEILYSTNYICIAGTSSAKWHHSTVYFGNLKWYNQYFITNLPSSWQFKKNIFFFYVEFFKMNGWRAPGGFCLLLISFLLCPQIILYRLNGHRLLSSGMTVQPLGGGEITGERHSITTFKSTPSCLRTVTVVDSLSSKGF